jgi:DeoR family deoxyribose operon repressor
MQNKVVRTNKIVSILRERNGSSIKELSRELTVSEMTIRRDLSQLQAANIVSLVHGAAIYKNNAPVGVQEHNYHLVLEKAVKNPEKEQLGKAAARLVMPEDTIIIDIGTTTEHLARYIPQNCPITVLCFTINILFEVYKKNVDNLIMGGGYYHTNTQLFESQEAINLIHRIRANKYFMSAAGVSGTLGLTCMNQYEVGIKQACLESSLQKILLVDSSKFDQIKPSYFAPLEKIDTVITDSGISPEWVKIMEDLGITVQVAGSSL